MYIWTTGIIGHTCAVRINYRKWVARYLWEAMASEASSRGTPKLELEMLRVHSINQKPHTLSVIYTYNASATKYTCCLNIHYLLYNCSVIACKLTYGVYLNVRISIVM